MMVTFSCRKRKLSLDVVEFGTIVFLSEFMFSGLIEWDNILASWLDGQDEFDVDGETFISLLMLYSFVKSGLVMKND